MGLALGKTSAQLGPTPPHLVKLLVGLRVAPDDSPQLVELQQLIEALVT
jgi:hypothetical protein